MQFHLVWYNWINNNKIFTPGLISRVFFDEKAKNEIFIPLTNGQKFTLSVIDGPFCVGYRNSPNHFHSCPFNNKIKKGNQCDYCSKQDTIIPCAKCKGEYCYNPKYKKKCDQTNHIVYLASFNEVIKVGTALSSRYLKRLIEQGADYGTIIAETPNGIMARNIESKICTLDKITDRINYNTKLRNLFSKKESSRDLMDCFKNIKFVFSEYDTYFKNKLDVIEIQNTIKNTCVFGPVPIEIKKGLKIDGKVLGVKGSILLLDRNQVCYTLDLRRLSGWRVLKK